MKKYTITQSQVLSVCFSVGFILLFTNVVHADQNLVLQARKVTLPVKDSPLFQAMTWDIVAPMPSVQAEPEPMAPAIEAPPPPPPPPSAPNLPFRFVGRMLDQGHLTLFIEHGAKVHSLRAGQIINQQYRLDKITAHEAVFTYLPYQQQQTLIFNSNAIGQTAWQTPNKHHE